MSSLSPFKNSVTLMIYKVGGGGVLSVETKTQQPPTQE